MIAKVELIESIDGHSACSDSRWDTLPEWSYWPAWIVSVVVTGTYNWGPVKYRKNAKKTHSGTSLIEIRHIWLFSASNEAYRASKEDEALECALSTIQSLEQNGFRVESTVTKNCKTQGLRSTLKWTANPAPDRLQSKLNPQLEDLSPIIT